MAYGWCNSKLSPSAELETAASIHLRLVAPKPSLTDHEPTQVKALVGQHNHGSEPGKKKLNHH
eukprot:4180821-Amphidinium_carterae.1